MQPVPGAWCSSERPRAAPSAVSGRGRAPGVEDYSSKAPGWWALSLKQWSLYCLGWWSGKERWQLPHLPHYPAFWNQRQALGPSAPLLSQLSKGVRGLHLIRGGLKDVEGEHFLSSFDACSPLEPPASRHQWPKKKKNKQTTTTTTTKKTASQ